MGIGHQVIYGVDVQGNDAGVLGGHSHDIDRTLFHGGVQTNGVTNVNDTKGFVARGFRVQPQLALKDKIDSVIQLARRGQDITRTHGNGLDTLQAVGKLAQFHAFKKGVFFQFVGIIGLTGLGIGSSQYRRHGRGDGLVQINVIKLDDFNIVGRWDRALEALQWISLNHTMSLCALCLFLLHPQYRVDHGSGYFIKMAFFQDKRGQFGDFGWYFLIIGRVVFRIH